jgi:hypothetical protein
MGAERVRLEIPSHAAPGNSDLVTDLCKSQTKICRNNSNPWNASCVTEGCAHSYVPVLCYMLERR